MYHNDRLQLFHTCSAIITTIELKIGSTVISNASKEACGVGRRKCDRSHCEGWVTEMSVCVWCCGAMGRTDARFYTRIWILYTTLPNSNNNNNNKNSYNSIFFPFSFFPFYFFFSVIYRRCTVLGIFLLQYCNCTYL